MGQLNLRVLIEAVDRATQPLRGITRGIQGLVRPAKIAGMAAGSLGRDLRQMAIVGGAAVASLGFAMFRMVKRTADAGEAALAASQKTGVAVRSYQRLSYAATQLEATTEDLDQGLKFLNQSIDAAGRGSAMDARAFAQLGISIRDTNGEVKPTEELFLEVADAMYRLENGSQKTGVAMALFGRSGTELVPMLNAGGAAIARLGDEAEATGQVLSEEAAANADAFNDSVGALQGQIAGLGNSITIGLLPELISLVEWLRRMIASNRPEIVRQLQGALTDVAAAAPAVISGVKEIVGLLGDVARVVGPLVRAIGGFNGVLDIMAALMIGRVAIAIWAATSAVMGLNVAMWANPIGLVIAGIAALIVSAWLLYRNWNNIVSGLKVVWGLYLRYCSAVWDKMKAAFKAAVGALWQLLPPWLRMIFRGAAFALKVVGQGLNGGGGGGGGGGARPPAARPNVGPARSQVGGTVDVRIRSDGRASVTGVRSSNDAVPVTASTYRGSYGD